MPAIKKYAAQTRDAELAPRTFDRRDAGPHDVQFDSIYGGYVNVIVANNDCGLHVAGLSQGRAGSAL